MAIGNYEIWLTTDTGIQIQHLNPIQFDAGRKVSGIGYFTMSLMPNFDTSLINVDRMVQIWRSPPGSQLSLWRCYFIRKWEFSVDSNGATTISISGPDTNDLLRRRIIAAYDGSDEASAGTNVDSAISELMRDSMDDTIEPTPDEGTREWDYLEVVSSSGIGPVIDRSFSFEKYLTQSGGGIVSELLRASREAESEVFFDIVPSSISPTGIAFEFRQYYNQPGQDVSDRVVFSLERGNLLNPKLTYDYTEEINYVYAGGKGREDNKRVLQVADSERYNASIWNRCEAFVNSYEETDDEITNMGRDALEKGRPIRKFEANVVDTQNARFQQDWDIGYKVTAQFMNYQFETIIRSVVLLVDRNGEKIDAKLEWEASV